MKISIITVCYNSKNTIGKTLRSVRDQTYENIEHIIVDGGSTDLTTEIILSEGAHVSKYVSERDEGIYDAINKGILLSSGEIIGLVHSNDVYAHQDVLAFVVDVFSDSEVDAVFGDAAFFRLDDRDRIVRRYRSNRFSPRMLAWGWMPAHTALFFRRRVFDQYGLYKTDYQIGGDFEFVARVFRDSKLNSVYLPEILVHMSIGGVSTGGWRNTVLLNQEVLRACRENGIKTNMLKILSKYPLKALEFLWP